MNEFCQQTVAFGTTDISYSTGQSVCATSQVPYPFQYMPTVAGGLSFEYNLTGQNGQQVTNLILNAPVLEGIFTGAINNWNDPQIAALNPTDRLPNQQIDAFYRGDPSGENYLLGDYFFHTAPGSLASFQPEAGVRLRASLRRHGRSSRRHPAESCGSDLGKRGGRRLSGPGPPAGWDFLRGDGLRQDVGLPVASVINAAGNAVQPSSYNVAVALTGAILYQDLTQNLAGVYTNTNPDAYRLSAYSYFIVSVYRLRRRPELRL